jgi:hypothetical protein
MPGFNFWFPFGLIEKQAFRPFFPQFLCHIDGSTALFAMDDAPQCPKTPPPAPQWKSS